MGVTQEQLNEATQQFLAHLSAPDSDTLREKFVRNPYMFFKTPKPARIAPGAAPNKAGKGKPKTPPSDRSRSPSRHRPASTDSSRSRRSTAQEDTYTCPSSALIVPAVTPEGPQGIPDISGCTPDFPLSPDDPYSNEMDTSSPADYIVVAPKGKKRAAASCSPPPSKAPCPPSGVLPPSQSASSSQEEPEAPAPRRERPPPPITLRDKGVWQQVAAELTAKNVKFSAQSNRQGIAVKVATSDDYRSLTRDLNAARIQYHRAPLEEEKVLRVVIRGLPKEIPEAPIHEDLKSQGFPVQQVHRMHGGRTKKVFDLVMVVLDKTQEAKAIFNLKTVLNLSGLHVETPRRKSTPGQCHRCQLYGHSARFCEADFRCVKCAGHHSTAECSRKKGDPSPPSCVLCGTQGHTANYRGCPRAPKAAKGMARTPPSRPRPHPQPQTQAAKFVAAPPPASNAWSKPPSMVQANRPIQPTSVPAPARTNPQARPAPQPKPAKPSPAPVASGSSNLMADLNLLTEIASAVDLDEVRTVALKLRNGGNLLHLLDIHRTLFSALKRFGPRMHS